MGTKTGIRFLVLTILFSFACVVVYGWDDAGEIKKKQSLTDIFGRIDRYILLRNIKLNDDAFQMLNLDDYVFADYNGKSGLVNLYIGYYFSADKAYASHSPTICYPSQGWKIETEPTSGKLKVGPHTINFTEITTSLGNTKELVLYWYQARLQTNTQVYKNKIAMGYNKWVYSDGHHGFVRVAVPYKDSNYRETKDTAVDFIRSFYPIFENYLTNS